MRWNASRAYTIFWPFKYKNTSSVRYASKPWRLFLCAFGETCIIHPLSQGVKIKRTGKIDNCGRSNDCVEIDQTVGMQMLLASLWDTKLWHDRWGTRLWHLEFIRLWAVLAHSRDAHILFYWILHSITPPWKGTAKSSSMYMHRFSECTSVLLGVALTWRLPRFR